MFAHAWWYLFAGLIGLGQAGEPLQELVQQSGFIFSGTVLQLNSSTIAVGDSSGLAVVRLGEVIDGGELLRSEVGKNITIRLKQPAAVKLGEVRWFFANSWIFGETIALSEVGSVRSSSPEAASLAADVARIRRGQEDRQLMEQLAASPLVVRGTVVAVGQPQQQRFISEHDPFWTAAEVTVAEVLKGSSPGKLTILFPSSIDVHWYQSPKLRVGQNSIFILRSGVSEADAALLGVTQPEDVLLPAESGRVRGLLGR